MKLHVAKPSVEWLLENPPSYESSYYHSMQQAVVQGIDSQIALLEHEMVPQTKKLTKALKVIAEYQQGVKSLQEKGETVALEKDKVDKFVKHVVSELAIIEAKMNVKNGHVMLIDHERKESESLRSKEHNEYAKRYANLKGYIFANKDYKAKDDFVDPVTGKDFYAK